MDANNNREYYSNLKADCENQLELNYGKIIKLENDLDSVSSAATKMENAVQNLVSINTDAYNKYGAVCYWYGLKYTETSDIITYDMQTEYNHYLEAIGEIKNSLIAKKSELEKQLEKLKKDNSDIYNMIGIYAYKIRTMSEE
ncbi:MAG: hypothetical protein E7257_10175 [Lachnospiraceae bacterium]|nr:hypothetical protein [Lachnospiraceae bacterium]